jgi:carotenoid cleavage dioxygenase-like enzyme
MTAPFPQTMDFSGHNLPSRIECDIYDLVVEGNLPPEIRGIWYQSVPDPQYPPKLGKDTFLSGDGMVRSFAFDGEGHVDFKQRYIRTERWLLEHKARKALFGAYRNPFTDDPSVAGKRRGAANTTPFFHGGRLLAFKEDSPPWELDPVTLETVGEWTFGGRLRSQTVTAHPRLDPATGEMHYFGYEATGLASTDVSYFVTNAQGELIKEELFKVPYCALMHDFVVTKDYVVFPGFPIVADLERMKAGGDHWGWDATKESFIGIMPRAGSVKDMRWFRGRPCSVFHFINGHNDGSKVHVDMCVSDLPAFEFMREAGGQDTPQETPLGPPSDFPRLADKDLMVDYNVAYLGMVDVRFGPPIVSGPVGAGFNTLARLETKTGRLTTYFPGQNRTMQEQVHVASAKPGHEGYLLQIIDRHDENQAEVHVLEAEHIDKGPIATLRIPMRLRSGVHGNWASAQALAGRVHP